MRFILLPNLVVAEDGLGELFKYLIAGAKAAIRTSLLLSAWTQGEIRNITFTDGLL